MTFEDRLYANAVRCRLCVACVYYGVDKECATCGVQNYKWRERKKGGQEACQDGEEVSAGEVDRYHG